MHSPVHALNAPRMVEKRDRHGVGKEALRRNGILRRGHAGERREWLKIAEAEIAGDAQHGGVEIVGWAVDPREECGELELANGDVEADAAEAGLDQLFERALAGADGQELYPSARGRIANRSRGGSPCTLGR